jgi:hypothetical protein
MAARSVLCLAAGLLFAGCTTLLPHSDSTIHTPWTSFEEAKTAIERLEPHHTTRGDLRAAGFDPFVNANVELLNYSDILRRFPLPGPVAKLDPGLRECLEAGNGGKPSITETETSVEPLGPLQSWNGSGLIR